MQEEVACLKQQLEVARLHRTHGSITYHDTRIEAPKPNVYKMKRNTQDIQNFIWQLKSYFEHVKVVEGAAKIRMVTINFGDVFDVMVA